MSEEQSNPATEAGTTTESASSEATTTETTTEAPTSEGVNVSYLDGKYNSVSALEEGYKNLQSTFSQKTAEYSKAMGGLTGAPEEYELAEGVELSDSMIEYAKENNFSNDALNGIAQAYRAEQLAAQESMIAKAKEELGKDADARLNNVNDWMAANLSEAQRNAIIGTVNTAQGVEAMEAIMKMNSGTAPAQVEKPKTLIDKDTLNAKRFAKDEYGRRKMSSDPQYKAQVDAMTAEFIANGGKLN